MGVLPNSTTLERHGMIDVGCLTPTKEAAAYGGKAPILFLSSKRKARKKIEWRET